MKPLGPRLWRVRWPSQPTSSWGLRAGPDRASPKEELEMRLSRLSFVLAVMLAPAAAVAGDANATGTATATASATLSIKADVNAKAQAQAAAGDAAYAAGKFDAALAAYG